MLWSTVTPTLTYALESGGVAVAGSADPALEFIAVSTWGAKGGGAPSFFCFFPIFSGKWKAAGKTVAPCGIQSGRNRNVPPYPSFVHVTCELGNSKFGVVKKQQQKARTP